MARRHDDALGNARGTERRKASDGDILGYYRRMLFVKESSQSGASGLSSPTCVVSTAAALGSAGDQQTDLHSHSTPIPIPSSSSSSLSNSAHTFDHSLGHSDPSSDRATAKELTTYCTLQAPTAAVLYASPREHRVLRSWIIGKTATRQVPINDKGMGAFLDKPKTEKSNWAGVGTGVRYAVAAMQGWRVDMEDAHVVKIGVGHSPPFDKWSFFGVFDGHAGTKVAQHSSENLLASVLATEQFQKLVAELEKDSTKAELTDERIQLLKEGVVQGFLTLDAQMKDKPEIHGENERSGTTAVCALITPTHIFVANLGDSRAVLSKDGVSSFGTEDHKPFLPKERDRIMNAGGSVMIQRVNGSLAVSRALGDFEYKSVPGLQATQQLVSPEPDMYTLNRTKTDEYLLLACDGVYDVMSNAELCDFVRSRMRVTDDLASVANQVLDACLSKGSRDNMSIVLVAFDGAPKVCVEEQKKDAQWKHSLEDKVAAIVAEEQNSDNQQQHGHDDHDSEMDIDFVMRHLLHAELPNLPPGAGIHGARAEVEAILERLKGKSGDRATPNNVSASR